MKKIKFVGLLLGLGIVLALTGCNRNENIIRVFNWGNYLDESILAEFTAQTGIRVSYSTYATNEEMHTRLTAGGGGFDLVFPTDYMVERMIREDLLLPINLENIPNIRYIDQRFRGLEFDPHNVYSVPYKWGTLGILYNTAMVEALAPGMVVDSWNILWDARFGGSIFMYYSMRDAFVAPLKLLGYSINTTNPDELFAARDLLIAQRPLIRAYLGDPIKHSMIGNEAALAMVFSGCAMFTMEFNSDLNFIVPREGTNVWFDNMVIPRGARNQAGAEAFINFLSDPEIALRNTLYTGFSTTNWATFALLPEEIRNNPVYWPSDEVIDNSETQVHVGEFTATWERAWIEVLAARP
ncbi:MAG: spermidine/putrescine ABC transporter substrate-binding protein [Defluviitaleaceae bacterium]|nr:spermidine/putrescine ABC transporter substrate-binding protein [Defluviitaleaceae bacterium]MCL2238837.1 spermidine/putrescine ABC transporter substrate-binding protein [Defluviitaleaceae bacterium]